MYDSQPTPITLITGYLGSGKTTLVNQILRNCKNYKMAVIVNDIGEVNIDADLIANDGIVNSDDESLVALSNGCICCTLKKDLINQLDALVGAQKFDHILIEASGICEPVPIAQTITYMEEEYAKQGVTKPYFLDAVISVTDALRLRDEFGCGESLTETERGEENLENLIIQQIEFCDIIILNKTSLISKKELKKVNIAIKALQPSAQIIESDFCDFDIEKIIDTGLFNFDKASTSAAWAKEFDDWSTDVEKLEDEDEDDEDAHDHHRHHEGIENEEEEGTALEYNISTFVYYRRPGFDLEKFKTWIEEESEKHHIIRAKGICYFTNEQESIYVYESAGIQNTLTYSRKWFSATLGKKQLEYLRDNDENYDHDWDDEYEDRLNKIVFIGQNLDEKAIRKELDQI